ncbi:hypothetical protein D3C77_16980 [compost metagenome]
MMSWFKPIYALYLAVGLTLVSLAYGQYIKWWVYTPCMSAFGGQYSLQPLDVKRCSRIFTHKNMVVKQAGSDDAILQPLNEAYHRSTYRDSYIATKMDAPDAMLAVPEFDQWWAQLPVTRAN